MLQLVTFGAVSLVMLLAAISNSAVSVAFPVITSSFDTSLVIAGWVLSAFQLSSLAAMVVMGKVSDTLGKKNSFLFCLFLFVLGSLICAISPNILLLIVGRVIQGFGGGGFLPSAIGIIVDEFPNNRQKAIGLSMSIFPVGLIIGPNLGGWMVPAFGWRSIFWFNIPFGLLACIPLFLVVKSIKKEKERIDFLGAGFLVCAISALMLSISELEDIGAGGSWIPAAALFGVSITTLMLFIRRQGSAENPIIDPIILKTKAFIAANLYNFIFGMSVFGFFSFVPLYVVEVYGLSILQSGFILTFRSIGMIAATTVSSFFILRWGYHKPMLIGSVILAITLVLLGLQPSHIRLPGVELNDMTFLSLVVFLSGVGMGIASPAANNACIDLMPERAATITGVRGMFRQTGGAISITITTLVLHLIGRMPQGFYLVFLGMSVVILATIPFIFAMPDRANASLPHRKAR